jgi:Kae1-associated kinase Bud32
LHYSYQNLFSEEGDSIRGAEAVVTKTSFLGKPAVLKDRIKKTYREEHLDNLLRKRRTRAEARLLHKAKKAGVPCPTVLCMDEFSITMSFLEGKRPGMGGKEAEKSGNYLAKLHNNGIIHGDYTPANLIKTKKGLSVIDFGLGFFSTDIEDMAVDVFTMLKSINKKQEFLKGYRKSKRYNSILKRVEDIRKRMRYS